MSNSKLSTYADTSHGNWSSRNGQSICRITIHCAAGNLGMGGYSSILHNSNDCSWNYAVDGNGKIGLFVEECYRAWTSSSSENDSRSVTMEVSNTVNSDNSQEWPISSKAYNAVINLCEDICRRNGKKKLIWFGDKSKSLSYKPKSDEIVLTVHRWFANKSCPGNYLYSRQGTIASEVTKRLGGPNNIQYPPVDPDMLVELSSTACIDAESLINPAALSPYIITTSRSTGNLNYKALKKQGVVGVILESGSLFDTVHKATTLIGYRNPKLRQQVLSCIDAGVPWGLWHNTKARTVAEADKEIDALIAVIRLYPPMLGVWLKLNLVKSKSINDNIIDRYYKRLVEAGMRNKVGIYCNKSQLKNISWNRHQQNFLLWLISPISNTSDLGQLQSPGFFDVPK